jgi:hypothetical protein
MCKFRLLHCHPSVNIKRLYHVLCCFNKELRNVSYAKELKSDCNIKILSYILGMSFLTFWEGWGNVSCWSSKKPNFFWFAYPDCMNPLFVPPELHVLLITTLQAAFRLILVFKKLCLFNCNITFLPCSQVVNIWDVNITYFVTHIIFCKWNVTKVFVETFSKYELHNWEQS